MGLWAVQGKSRGCVRKGSPGLLTCGASLKHAGASVLHGAENLQKQPQSPGSLVLLLLLSGLGEVPALSDSCTPGSSPGALWRQSPQPWLCRALPELGLLSDVAPGLRRCGIAAPEAAPAPHQPFLHSQGQHQPRVPVGFTPEPPGPFRAWFLSPAAAAAARSDLSPTEVRTKTKNKKPSPSANCQSQCVANNSRHQTGWRLLQPLKLLLLLSLSLLLLG